MKLDETNAVSAFKSALYFLNCPEILLRYFFLRSSGLNWLHAFFTETLVVVEKLWEDVDRLD